MIFQSKKKTKTRKKYKKKNIVVLNCRNEKQKYLNNKCGKI